MINRINGIQFAQGIYKNAKKEDSAIKMQGIIHDKKTSTTESEAFTTYSASGAYQSQGAAYGNFILDKGTAAETTVFVNRGAFDAIVQHTTYNEPQWEELGCDDEKRWVVINGQRFEVPHTPEEKAMIKRMRRSLVDILDDLEEDKPQKPSNVAALKSNNVVMDMLKDIFGDSSEEVMWQGILT